MPNLYDATNLAELMDMLKAEQGDSDSSLAKKIGVSPNTVNRVRRGFRADDATLDKIAEYMQASRAWVYELAKGIPTRPRHPRPVSMLVALLEEAPVGVQEEVLALARALVETRKKQATKE